MKANTIGDFFKENTLREDFLFNSGDDLETITPSLDNVDGLSLIIVVEDAVRTITATDTDSVDQSSKTWILQNGAFGQGDVGATFVIAGSGSNDGSYVIATVVDEETVTSVGSPAGDETFTSAVTMEVTDLPLQATITFEVSNNYVQSTLPGLNQIPSNGDWADITDEFSPSFQDIAAAGNQYTQAYPLVARRGKLILTTTAGASYISIYYSAKGNR